MAIFKLLGACGVAISGIVFVKETLAYEKLKISQADAYIGLIEYIKNQVECYNIPIDKIIESCDRDILNKCGALNTGYKTVADVVNAANMYIDEEIVDILMKFANEFGTVYRDEQLKMCNYHINELREYRKKTDEKIVCLSFYTLLICGILKRSFKPNRSDVKGIIKTDLVSLFHNFGSFSRGQNLYQNIIGNFDSANGFVGKNQHGQIIFVRHIAVANTVVLSDERLALIH